MKHLIKSIFYSTPLESGWKDLAMIPGRGTLDITTADTENGPVTTYSLKAAIRRRARTGPASLDGDLKLFVFYDSGRTVTIGTDDLPVRLDVSDSDTMTVSCTWKKPSGLVP